MGFSPKFLGRARRVLDQVPRAAPRRLTIDDHMGAMGVLVRGRPGTCAWGFSSEPPRGVLRGRRPRDGEKCNRGIPNIRDIHNVSNIPNIQKVVSISNITNILIFVRGLIYLVIYDIIIIEGGGDIR